MFNGSPSTNDINCSFTDLTRAINGFAAKHQAKPDVFFEVLFNAAYHKILEIQETPSFELRFYAPMQTSPLLIAMDASTDLNNCTVTFKEKDIYSFAIKKTLAFFVTENIYPGYKYNHISYWGENGDGKLKSTFQQLFIPNAAQLRFLIVVDEDEELERKEAVMLQELKLLANAATQITKDEFQQRLQAILLKDAISCEIPNKYFIDFLSSPQAEAAIQRVKRDSTLWAAYAVPTANESTTLAMTSLQDRISANTVSLYKELLSQLEVIVGPYNITCQGTDVFEHAFVTIYNAGEIPKEARGPLPRLDSYLAHKLFMQTYIKMSEADRRQVSEVYTADAIQFSGNKVSLSYEFIKRDFMPKFVNLLESNAEFVKAMQERCAKVQASMGVRAASRLVVG